jgi:hypothetical protein
MTVADKEAAAEELLASTSVHDIPGAPAAPARKRRPRRKSATTRMALRKVKRMEKAQRLTYERRARARKLALRRAKRRK